MTGRVCIIRHRGYELVVRREAEALRDAGLHVDVICLREGNERIVESVDGITCYRLPMSRDRAGVFRYLLDYGSFFVAAALLVTVLHIRHRYAAIQVNTMPDVLTFTTLIPRVLGARTVVFMKEPSPELAAMTFGSQRVVRLFTWIEGAVLRYADLTFTVTEQLKERYVERGAEADKIHVVLNGPDPRYLHGATAPATTDAFTLVCHGTIEDRYGHLTLIDAVDLARRDVPNLRLLITGSGTGTQDVARRIDELGLGAHARLLGHIDIAELREVLAGADVGVVPMRSNPYSNLVHTNKMYEYMLLNTPVIATRLDAVTAYFDDDSVEFVPADDAHAMAAAIVRLHRDPDRRDQLARNAQQRYETYGWEQQRRIFVNQYRRLLEPAGASRHVDRRAYRATKRIMDAGGAAVLLAISWPLLLVLAVAVKLDSPGPAIYRGRRVGLRGREFDVLKFRTMYHGVDDGPHRAYVQELLRGNGSTSATGMFKLTEDERVTRVGRILRQWSLDELPQLLNVLVGDMSLVGPRPEVPYALEAYDDRDHPRFDVLPGMTGLWQVGGRANLTPRDMLDLDAQYAQTCSIRLDLQLLLKTLPAVLKREGSA